MVIHCVDAATFPKKQELFVCVRACVYIREFACAGSMV